MSKVKEKGSFATVKLFNMAYIKKLGHKERESKGGRKEGRLHERLNEGKYDGKE